MSVQMRNGDEMSDELRPCPFCGNTNIVVEPYNDAFLFCGGCGLENLKCDWNIRPIEDAQAARIAELEAALKSKVIIINNQEKRINELAERILKNV